MPPTWKKGNLTDHHGRHPIGKDKACWQDLLDKKGAPVSEAEYEAKSVEICAICWLEYCAEAVDQDGVFYAVKNNLEIPYRDRRRYYVDQALLTTITSLDAKSVVTCFHEHFGRPHVQGGHKQPQGELKDKYMRKIRLEESAKMIRKIEILDEQS
jgi:hypothetical protein